MDRLLTTLDVALRTVFAPARSSRAHPAQGVARVELDAADTRMSGALMRVNHVGEVCAQALYTGQALGTKDPALRAHLLRAAAEETDHLAWTQQRLHELGGRVSLLNPLWYAGAFGLGVVAARLGDPISLGFVVETERQVEAHLEGHLQGLPAADQVSRAVVAQMKQDEARHADEAQQRGAVALPGPVKTLMRAAAKLMTWTAHRI